MIQPQNPLIILGSSSVYRKELLSRLQLPFITIAPDIDETPYAHEKPEETAIRLARQKGQAIAAHQQNAVIITSDQVATTDGIQIGKPGSYEKALQQLQFMRGKDTIFHTAICVTDQRQCSTNPVQEANIQTVVTMRNLGDDELSRYLLIEQPYDCAGSAKNEGLGIAILENIRSNDPTALTGLPLITLTGMLRNLNIRFFCSE